MVDSMASFCISPDFNKYYKIMFCIIPLPQHYGRSAIPEKQ